jgi:PBP1b-binding outer membrane lipoprotein LpoB
VKNSSTAMKKVLAVVLLGLFLSACGYHTCPTYAKKEPVKQENSDQNV